MQEAKRGRPKGNGRRLTPAHGSILQKDLVDKTPDQVKLHFALWSAQAVLAHIQACFGANLPVRSVRNYLKSWGFTPQRPLKRAFEQRPAVVQKWLSGRKSVGAMKRRSVRSSIIRAVTRRGGKRRCWGCPSPSGNVSISLGHYQPGQDALHDVPRNAHGRRLHPISSAAGP
ncbi:winged helix-turn-helix domain-containing protein [Methylococcus sp. EFPC2]|uniref:winged helix-turn-helix domain-containing protein n=1 Tax=Methylococcus sp. EFPC2 TaxID=2812648 RepID=UPI0035305534